MIYLVLTGEIEDSTAFEVEEDAQKYFVELVEGLVLDEIQAGTDYEQGIWSDLLDDVREEEDVNKQVAMLAGWATNTLDWLHAGIQPIMLVAEGQKIS